MHLLTSTEEPADPRVAPQVLGGLLQEVLVLLQQIHRREVLQEIQIYISITRCCGQNELGGHGDGDGLTPCKFNYMMLQNVENSDHCLAWC